MSLQSIDYYTSLTYVCMSVCTPIKALAVIHQLIETVHDSKSKETKKCVLSWLEKVVSFRNYVKIALIIK